MHMKTVTLHRPNERFNKNISYDIFIGKKKITELKNGEEKVVEIPNEMNIGGLNAKIKSNGSNVLNLSELKENEKIQIRGNDLLNRKLIWIVSILPITGVLIFAYGRESLILKNIGTGLFFLILVFAFWGIIIAKNKWLKIEKL